MGYEPSLCFFRDCCGDAMILEYNGDLFSCDHFVYPAYRLGNLLESSLAEMARSPQQRAFGSAKKERLPGQCLQCPLRFACRGECPKHRFLSTQTGEPGLNYLCAGYTDFFTHVDPYMRFMANELSNRRPPANVMAWARTQTDAAPPKKTPTPNSLCPCGSGKKHKKCCGKKGAST